ncbi:hypothetical protein O3G_MSEX000043 [Manduca sexta]|nr:hypothetical protein O3G_MSEX000043 [Manduca sexta]
MQKVYYMQYKRLKVSRQKITRSLHNNGPFERNITPHTKPLTVSEKALLGLLAGVPFILPDKLVQTKQPTNTMAQNFFTDTCGVHCQTLTLNQIDKFTYI